MRQSNIIQLAWSTRLGPLRSLWSKLLAEALFTMAACSLRCNTREKVETMYMSYDETISGAKPSCKVCMPEASSPVVCGCTICSSSHFLSTSFSGRRSMLKASMHGRSTAAITRVSANFIIVSCRSRLVAIIVAANNNAIGLSTFLFIS